MDKAIKVNKLSKKYKLYHSTKERLFDLVSPKNIGEDFYALSNIDFEAAVGEVVGFVGINGSGKSTLSNIIAGIVPETSGTVTTNGQVALIAVAAGLKNDLTGRDNIELKLLMLGFNKEEIKNMEEEIIDFSELGKFIDQPVKSYSSGMKSRLGFSISVNIDPDILIIDEALSVGDKAFAEKSLEKMNEFKRDGKTMIFVSHSLGQMKQFCDKILWLEFGMVKQYGMVEEIMPQYEAFLKMWKTLNKKKRNEYQKKARNKRLDYQSFMKEADVHNVENQYEEKLISRIGRIRTGESYLYEAPDQSAAIGTTKSYKGMAYYIKKQVIYKDEKFYLISTEPSAVDGVVAWIKAADIASHHLIHVDYDKKTFELIGTGLAFDRPWGAKKNVVFPDLGLKKGLPFSVERTDKVGKNIWYFGTLEEEQVWIHYSHLTSLEQN